jgi:hypothetical protein
MSRWVKWLAVLAVFVAQGEGSLAAQINPAEITNPRLKQPEQTYLHQLIALNRSIAQIRTPFPFSLRRYIGLDSKNPLGGDTRGVEFVMFHNQVVLKVSGDYNAAFSGESLTRNQRALKVFDDVITPILGVLPGYLPSAANFDACGFEVAYHVLTRTRSYEYEGKEILTVVMSKADALSYSRIHNDAQRQRILDDSQIYLDGDRFGLALRQREPYPMETLEGKTPAQASQSSERNEASSVAAVDPTPRNPEPAQAKSGTTKTDPVSSVSLGLDSRPVADRYVPMKPPTQIAPATGAQKVETESVPKPDTRPTQNDLNALQTKYQQQFGALAKEGMERYHFVNYAPPSLVDFRHQIYLQLTLRNPTPFNRSATSIYRRAAQDFDLFLAPLLRPMLGKVPPDEEIAGMDITVLNQFGGQAGESAEAIEFICPLPILRRFADEDVTSQDVIDHSMVLVNTVRISLDLQQAE